MDNETGTKAFKCLQALLKGETLHRKKLGDMGIADNNDSLHSYASYLRHQRLIPVESTKNSDGTCDYFMLPREIDRFRNPVSRIQQKEEMRSLIERERQEKLIEDFFRFLTRLNEFPILWNFWCDLPFRLAEISTDINALLNHEESVNQ
ncbi:TPA: hypothetical protein JBA24_14360 [Legionella pneumophila]|nr:hypothetical protein [Legionella pneumophila]HAT8712368.1 hypothetical protein [Legionella pneumophila]HEH5945701.1 hypothetical protein [Legionella pneumophila]HEH5959004.1 hypothetical protein [Legionella pneumophila]